MSGGELTRDCVSARRRRGERNRRNLFRAAGGEVDDVEDEGGEPGDSGSIPPVRRKRRRRRRRGRRRLAPGRLQAAAIRRRWRRLRGGSTGAGVGLDPEKAGGERRAGQQVSAQASWRVLLVLQGAGRAWGSVAAPWPRWHGYRKKRKERKAKKKPAPFSVFAKIQVGSQYQLVAPQNLGWQNKMFCTTFVLGV